MSKTLDAEAPVGSSLKGISEAFWLETQPEGYPLGDWIGDQREQGVAWRHISTEVRERTGGVVDLPVQTLINWYGDADRAAA